jgi:hypothetical protein
MNYSSVKHKKVMVNNISNHNNTNTSLPNINGKQYKQPQQCEPLLCKTLNSNGQQYNQPKQYKQLLCQISNSNGQQYSQPQQYKPLLWQISNSN